MKIGIIGSGFIGSGLVNAILAKAKSEIEIAFISSQLKPDNIPSDLWRPYSKDLKSENTDLIIEATAPDFLETEIMHWLSRSSVMPLSLSAFARDDLYIKALNQAEKFGHNLYIPSGAAAGFDTLVSHKDEISEVIISTIKPPSALPENFQMGCQLSFSGSTREACLKFPRNVNSHAAIALATLGFDKTRSVVISDPTATKVKQTIVAKGSKVQFSFERESELSGVSGLTLVQSLLFSIKRAFPFKEKVVFC